MMSVEVLRARVAPTPEGLTLQQLRCLAEEVGLPCRSAQVSTDRLGQVTLPAIMHLRDGHYVVLHELRPGGVVVGDPATGIVTWDRASLTRCYSGVLLLFGPPGGEKQ
jgi:ABC-type bacteriocin/lantibiotic exporter with double-glycine peptidase domain